MTRVAIDGDPNHWVQADAAEIEDHRWNGWALPWFTTAEALKILDGVNDPGDRTVTLRYDPVRDVFSEYDDNENESHDCPTMERGHTRLHAIGDGWCWSEVAE